LTAKKREREREGKRVEEEYLSESAKKSVEERNYEGELVKNKSGKQLVFVVNCVL
jgi:hypothetical protein